MSIKLLKYFSDAPEALIDMASPEFAAALPPSQERISSGYVPVAGGTFSYASPAYRNSMPLPLGNSLISIERDFALTTSISSGLVAFVSMRPRPGENLIHFDLIYQPILRLKGIGQQSARIPLAPASDHTLIKVAFVLWNESTGTWDRVGSDVLLETQSQSVISSATPILNTSPACPTALLSYRGRYSIPCPANPDADKAAWYLALDEVTAGIRPINTVGIALLSVTTPVSVVMQSPATANFALDGAILITSPALCGNRGHGGTSYPSITIRATSAYDPADTAVF